MENTFEQDIKTGLSAKPKFIPSQYFYDAIGDQLFQKIMDLEEYYLPRVEMEIIASRSDEIFNKIPFEKVDIVELGAGDGSKTLRLLKNFRAKGLDFKYIPLDISSNVLEINAFSFQQQMPDIEVKPISGNYKFTFGQLSQEKRPKLVLFLGSNIGNFPPQKAIEFLTELVGKMNPNDLLLMGVDLKKNPHLIAAAYNDKQKVTREFNMNLLGRINRELGGDFKINRFEHYPFYDPIQGAAYSFLVSLEQQEVTLNDGTVFYFEKNELIHTEVSQKYTLSDLEDLTKKIGFKQVNHFTDPLEFFSLSLFCGRQLPH